MGKQKKTMSEMIDASKLKKDLNKTSKQTASTLDGEIVSMSTTKKVVNKGGRPKKPENEKGKTITLKVPPALLGEIDTHLKSQNLNNRTAWMLQAAAEKLQRDKSY